MSERTRMTHAEEAALRKAFERDKWAGEWNSLPTAIDRLLQDRAEQDAWDSSVRGRSPSRHPSQTAQGGTCHCDGPPHAYSPGWCPPDGPSRGARR